MVFNVNGLMNFLKFSLKLNGMSHVLILTESEKFFYDSIIMTNIRNVNDCGS
jgi:hypothetical protein